MCVCLGGISLCFLPCQSLAQACGPCPPSLQPSTSFQDCTVSECATGFRYWLCASCERYGLRPLT